MKIREKICIWLFEKSKVPYAKYFKSNIAWNLSKTDLLSFPTNTLGYELGLFLTTNEYHLIPKLEKHDAYHVITKYGTSVKDEIALQYFFLGNKKRSPYLFGVIIIGAILLPENIAYYYSSYLQGKHCTPFHKWNIRTLLNEPLNKIRDAVFTDANTYFTSKNEINHI
jgi:ubiquinone biosynthesis protein Coq4